MLSLAEENYLKTIYKLEEQQVAANADKSQVGTNLIAEQLQTKAGSVTEMLKKLSDKELVDYLPYQGVNLTDSGKSKALGVIRRHRLWETFLVQTLGFQWDQVHALAEELEHVRSEELMERLDAFLQWPAFDPHGDPIPSRDGRLTTLQQVGLDTVPEGTSCILTGVKDHDPEFLRYLHSLQLNIGCRVQVKQRISYDGSHQVSIDGGLPIQLSLKVAANLQVVV